MKTLEDFNFEDKKALVRVDFNVPLDAEFKVTDTSRIDAAKPTILKILEDGGSAVLMSHMGRPKGQRNPDMSLQHICNTVSEIIGVQVKFVDDCVGEKVDEAYANLENGEILLLENLRFYNEETNGDATFAEQLSKYGDIYVNDAFGTAHRAHASTTIVANYFLENKCFGYLLAKEIKAIEKVMQTGEKPVTAILGGAKVSSKITIIENILDKVDHLIIGGGMTYTFIKAQGGKVGDSICEDDKMALALDILKQAKEKGVEIHLPVDVLAANAFDNDAKTQAVAVDAIPDGWQGLDAGPATLDNFRAVILNSKTILWNGPVGVFEMESFAKGTIAIGNAIDEATQNGRFFL
jgi:phosphoglycerate kinase